MCYVCVRVLVTYCCTMLLSCATIPLVWNWMCVLSHMHSVYNPVSCPAEYAAAAAQCFNLRVLCVPCVLCVPPPCRKVLATFCVDFLKSCYNLTMQTIKVRVPSFSHNYKINTVLSCINRLSHIEACFECKPDFQDGPLTHRPGASVAIH